MWTVRRTATNAIKVNRSSIELHCEQFGWHPDLRDFINVCISYVRYPHVFPLLITGRELNGHTHVVIKDVLQQISYRIPTLLLSMRTLLFKSIHRYPNFQSEPRAMHFEKASRLGNVQVQSPRRSSLRRKPQQHHFLHDSGPEVTTASQTSNPRQKKTRSLSLICMATLASEYFSGPA